MSSRRETIFICGDEGPLTTPDPDCSNAAEHTPQPDGYVAWHAWAAKMTWSHIQKRCPACGLWNVWTPRVLRVLDPPAAQQRERSEPQ